MEKPQVTLVYDPRACGECGAQLDIRNQSGLCRPCFARSLAQRQRKPPRHCRQCGKKIEQRNKTGFCRRCWGANIGRISHKPRSRRIPRNRKADWVNPQTWLLEIRIPQCLRIHAPAINAIFQKFQSDLESMIISSRRDYRIKVVFCLVDDEEEGKPS